MAFIFDSHYFLYILAISGMIIIVIIEFITFMSGVALSQILDNCLPSIDAYLDTDIDVDTDINLHPEAVSFLGHTLEFLGFGKVPFLIVLISFLTCFELIGIGFNIFIFKLFKIYPASWSVFFILLIALYVNNKLIKQISKIIPSAETYVVSKDSFIGKPAKILIGEVSNIRHASAQLIDDYGHIQNVRVIAANENEVFKKGDKVLIVDKKYFEKFKTTLFLVVEHNEEKELGYSENSL